MKVSINIPPSVAPRVKRAAAVRGLDVPTYVVTLLAWHSPAFDNDSQWLKSQIKSAIEHADESDGYGTTLNTILEMVE